ncbi:hypothetical protein BDR05DRAFT_961382 [Suillus weaverae]|nr:hypothetical protein BDR05DRAFT_961382 [Suillus weaverae]
MNQSCGLTVCGFVHSGIGMINVMSVLLIATNCESLVWVDYSGRNKHLKTSWNRSITGGLRSILRLLGLTTATRTGQ